MSEPAHKTDNEWLTSDDLLINPDAPAGGGGPGAFHRAGPAGVEKEGDDLLPSPDSPAARHLETPDPLDAVPLVNAPPATVPRVVNLKPQQNTATVEIAVDLEVLADATGLRGASQADTQLLPTNVDVAFPEMDFPTQPGVAVDEDKVRITKLVGKLTVKGRATIQTRYRQGVSSSDTSAYGRGTTPGDKTTGNITVGFHESCHIADMVGWLTTHPIPTNFTGKVGMTITDYKAAMKTFGDAQDAHWAAASSFSEASTDEAPGSDPTHSTYLLTHGQP